HRVLETLEGEALRDELAGARDDLERETGQRVQAIAYPVGRAIRAPWIRNAVIDAGYRVGFANAGGVNPVWPGALRSALGFDPLNLRRIATERTMSDAMFLTELAIPPLGY
ncbi:MAG TPA: polysaccharide deacetylase family protein, partial [Kofleriaceae bacterium]|nr:polysaccharide deacetylase family protein [Kofleriaceae bacterium]